MNTKKVVAIIWAAIVGVGLFFAIKAENYLLLMMSCLALIPVVETFTPEDKEDKSTIKKND